MKKRYLHDALHKFRANGCATQQGSRILGRPALQSLVEMRAQDLGIYHLDDDEHTALARSVASDEEAYVIEGAYDAGRRRRGSGHSWSLDDLVEPTANWCWRISVMFAVRTRLFSNLAPHEVGKFSSVDDAVAFAKTRFQFALEIWIERAGIVVVNYEQLRRGFTPTI